MDHRLAVLDRLIGGRSATIDIQSFLSVSMDSHLLKPVSVDIYVDFFKEYYFCLSELLEGLLVF